jgi:hypothetical protein
MLTLRAMDLRRPSRSSSDVGAGDRESSSPRGGGSIRALHRYGAAGGGRSPALPSHQHGRSWVLQSGPHCRPLIDITAAECCSQVTAVAPASASPQSGVRIATRAVVKGGGSRAATHFIKKGGNSRSTSVGQLGLPAFRGGRRGIGVVAAAVEVQDGSRMGTTRRKLLRARSGSTVSRGHGGAGAVMMCRWIPDDLDGDDETLARMGQGAVEP